MAHHRAPAQVTVNGIVYVRSNQAPVPEPKAAPASGKVERNCQWCGKPFKARAADVKRGWAKFCSKSCKASEQEKRTHQYRNLGSRGGDFDADMAHRQAMDESTGGWDEGGWRRDESGCAPYL